MTTVRYDPRNPVNPLETLETIVAHMSACEKRVFLVPLLLDRGTVARPNWMARLQACML